MQFKKKIVLIIFPLNILDIAFSKIILSALEHG